MYAPCLFSPFPPLPSPVLASPTTASEGRTTNPRNQNSRGRELPNMHYSPLSLSRTAIVASLIAAQLADGAVLINPGSLPIKDLYHMCSGIRNAMCKREHTWEEQPWECIDITRHVRHCGGCKKPMYGSETFGQDCTLIPGQKSVECRQGLCVVTQCQTGWLMSLDRKRCREDFDEGD